METDDIPSLSEVLEPLMTKYGMARDFKYELTSKRPKKIDIGMKTWKHQYAEVFVYEDNTVGLRSFLHTEVEKDLNAVDPRFLTELENWLIAVKTKVEGVHGSVSPS